MRKYIIGLFVFAFIFIVNLDFVNAGCVSDDYGFFTNQTMDNNERTIDKFCGPYYSFDENDKTYIIVELMANSKAYVHEVLNGYSWGDNYKEKYGYMKTDFGTCPEYIKINKNDEGIPSMEGNMVKFEITDGKDKDGFYIADTSKIMTCKYSYSNAEMIAVFYNDEFHNRHSVVLNKHSGNSRDSNYIIKPFDYVVADDVGIVNNNNLWFADETILKQFDDELKGKIAKNNDQFDVEKYNYYVDEAIDEFKNFNYNECPNLYAINDAKFDSGSSHGDFPVYLISPSLYSLALVRVEFNPNKKDQYFIFKGKPYNLESKINSFDIEVYEKKFNDCELIMDDVDKNNCIQNVYYEFQKYVTDYENFCNNVYSSCDVGEYPVTWCFGLDEKILKIKSKINFTFGSCGVSNDVIKWIANIFKWVKYIAPVLVIILSIIDFIKAFASQNDDEMKKVQGKFVKRLIAAALLFIVPFIIEFALDKFNLVNDNPFCNLV